MYNAVSEFGDTSRKNSLNEVMRGIFESLSQVNSLTINTKLLGANYYTSTASNLYVIYILDELPGVLLLEILGELVPELVSKLVRK
jgi:hypothetical protein